MENIASNELVQRISGLLNDARHRIVQSVNHTMVLTYFEIGRMIVEEEQNGNVRADYGAQLLKTLSIKLTIDLAKASQNETWSKCASFTLYTQKRRQCLRFLKIIRNLPLRSN